VRILYWQSNCPVAAVPAAKSADAAVITIALFTREVVAVTATATGSTITAWDAEKVVNTVEAIVPLVAGELVVPYPIETVPPPVNAALPYVRLRVQPPIWYMLVAPGAARIVYPTEFRVWSCDSVRLIVPVSKNTPALVGVPVALVKTIPVPVVRAVLILVKLVLAVVALVLIWFKLSWVNTPPDEVGN
jgi:hypothetical protein